MARTGRSRKGLYVIGAGAAVSLWGGWVGLGGLAGFGSVTLFPGIPVLSRLVVDLAITLPFTMEAYAGVAVGFALDRTLPKAARKYALFTAIGSILMAMGAQAGFHLLTALHRHAAPWEVVMLVSWVPLAVFIMATGLYHLAERPAPDDEAPEPAAVPAPVLSRVAALDLMARTITPVPEPAPVHHEPPLPSGAVWEAPKPERWTDEPALARHEPEPPDEPAPPASPDDFDREAEEVFGTAVLPARPQPEPPAKPARPAAPRPAPAGKWTPESAGVSVDEVRQAARTMGRNELARHFKVGSSTASKIKREYGQEPALAGSNGSR